MIRAEYFFLDVQDVLMALFKSLENSAPWSSWRFIKDYPDIEEFREFSNNKPIIFLERFFETGSEESQGRFLDERINGADTVRDWGYTRICEARLGMWLHRKHGGPDEAQIMRSRLTHLLTPPKGGLPGNSFNVTYLSGVTVSGTTLWAEGVRGVEMDGGRELATEDANEYREEIRIRVAALYGESVVV